MRRRFSSLIARLLLAVFLAGGLVAPALHLVHHAEEQEIAWESELQCTHGQHDAPAVEHGADATVEWCWMLARHVLDLPAPPTNQAPPPRRESAFGLLPPARYTSSLEGPVVIRGPPRA